MSKYATYADVSVSIKNDTTNTDFLSIPIYGSTANWTGKTAEYTFQLGYAQCNILEIVANSDYALKANTASFTYDWWERTLVVKVTDIAPNFNGTLFAINVELSPRMDFYGIWEQSITIEPKTVRVYGNGTDTTIALSGVATILIDKENPDQTFREDISLNYPNPFNYETIVFFSIDKPSKIEAKLFSFSGEIVQNIPKDTKGPLLFTIYDSFNKEISEPADYEFPQGIYKIIFRVNAQMLAVGHYRFLLETDNSSHSIYMSFMN
jgi:hypothetical protein